LASRLAEDANRTILVLEAGGFPTVESDIEVPILADIVRNSDQFNWRYSTVPQKHACKAHVDQVRNHPTYVTNSIPPVVSLLPPGLPPRTFAWTVSSELLGFCFYFFLIFRFWAVR